MPRLSDDEYMDEEHDELESNQGEPEIRGFDDNNDDDELLSEEEDEEPFVEGEPYVGLIFGAPCERQMPLKRLYDMYKKGVIDLSPSYQREVVWPPKNKSDLIISFCRGIKIPQVVFNVVVRPDAPDVPMGENEPWRFENPNAQHLRRSKASEKQETWECADGKQRLTTIFEFFNGAIPIVCAKTGYHYYYRKPEPKLMAKSTTKLLSVDYRRRFENLYISAVCYDNLSSKHVHSLFRCIQQGIPLKAAEILRSVDTEMASWTRKLCAEYDTGPGSFEHRVILHERAKDFQHFLTITLILIDGFDNSGTYMPAALELRLQDTPPSQEQREAIRAALDRFKRLTLIPRAPGVLSPIDKTRQTKLIGRMPDAHLPHDLWMNPKLLAPIELHWLPMLVTQFSQQSDGELLEIIELFRQKLNTRHRSEVKTNSKVTTTIKAFIGNFNLASLKHKYNDDGSLTAAGPMARGAPQAPVAPARAPVPAPAAAPAKKPVSQPRQQNAIASGSRSRASASTSSSTPTGSASASSSRRSSMNHLPPPPLNAPPPLAGRQTNNSQINFQREDILLTKAAVPLPHVLPSGRALPLDRHRAEEARAVASGSGSRAPLPSPSGATQRSRPPPPLRALDPGAASTPHAQPSRLPPPVAPQVGPLPAASFFPPPPNASAGPSSGAPRSPAKRPLPSSSSGSSTIAKKEIPCIIIESDDDEDEDENEVKAQLAKRLKLDSPMDAEPGVKMEADFKSEIKTEESMVQDALLPAGRRPTASAARHYRPGHRVVAGA